MDMYLLYNSLKILKFYMQFQTLRISVEKVRVHSLEAWSIFCLVNVWLDEG